MFKNVLKQFKFVFLEILMIFICYISFEIFFSMSYSILKNENLNILMLDINSLIVSFTIHYLIYHILKNIVKNSILSEVINLLFIYILGIISIIKIFYLNIPILISDVNFISGLSEIYKLVNLSDVFNILINNGILFILIIVIVVSIISLLFFSKFVNKKGSFFKLIIGIICLLIILIPSVFNILTADFLENKIYPYSKIGFYSGIYNEYLNEKNKNEVNKENIQFVENVLNSDYSKDNKNNWGKPNVIFVLSEAFWDINKIDDKIKFDKNIMDDFYQISEKSQLINIISPTYAGMTTNIEYEIMTGNSMRYFNSGYIPFNNIYVDNNSDNLPSIVKFFNNEGYDTTIISPFDNGELYNIKKAYKYLGFKNILLKNDLVGGEKRGKHYLDEHVLSFIPEKIKNEDENVFMFVKTAQNHMPYDNGRYSEENFNINIISSEGSEEDNKILMGYAQGLYDANKSLKQLYDEIQNIDEDTIVIYFGDHLPCLNNSKSEDLLMSWFFDNYSDESKYKETVFSQFNTQAIIFSNYEIETDDFKYLSFDGLSAYVLHNLNIKTDNYFEWLYENLYNYAAGNEHLSVDINGNLYLFNELDKKQKDIYEKKESFQYYILNNY